MYDTTSTAALAQILNQFSAPMFAVERTSFTSPFVFIAMNDAMENAAAVDRHDLIDMPLTGAFAEHDRTIAEHRYAQCIATRAVLRFNDPLVFLPDHDAWDTTLQCAMLPDGRERVIATCMQDAAPKVPAQNVGTLDDIQYFSAIADFQIQNLISMFEIYPAQELLEGQTEQRIEKLSGMCRTVQRAVADIKKSVRTAQFQHSSHPAQARTAPHRQAMFNRCGTLRAMTEVSDEIREQPIQRVT